MTRGVRRLVWPELRHHGFSAFTGRTAWRYVKDVVDVVNFQSFGPALADSVGCTSFSFSINLGVWVPQDAWSREPKRDPDGHPRPAEYECEPHRKRLDKSLSQPWFEPYKSDPRRWLPSVRRHKAGLKKVLRTDIHDRPDTWFVLPDGANLSECLDDALRALHQDGLPWFALRHPDE